MATPVSRSHWRIAWRRLRRRKLAMACLGVVALFLVVAFLDFVPVDPAQEARDLWSHLRRDGIAQGLLAHRYTGKTVLDLFFPAEPEDSYVHPWQAPGTILGATDVDEPIRVRHFRLLGTDVQGEDTLHQTVKACSTALVIGGLTTLIVIPIAVLLGMLAGYFGGWIDDCVQYVYSTLASIPDILLLVGIMTVLGQGLPQLCFALGVTTWVGLCRIIRGEVLKQRELDYVLAMRAMGAGNIRILFRHILPNVFPIILIAATLRFSGLILSESVLSYIGIGVRPGTASWGAMIADAQYELQRDPVVWWNLTAAGCALFVVVLAFNILGDALRDALDPRVAEEE